MNQIQKPIEKKVKYLMLGENILLENMTDEDFYFRIIDLLENSRVVLANYMLNYLSRKIVSKEVLKNCLILILFYLRKDSSMMDKKNSRSIHELDTYHKKMALNVLKDEFFTN
ncbi:MAG: hypothetical protein KAW66_03735 [Candidatus Lokiarchaeota archaeon]|nr:hypothetical protein [Candidatus Lokiarchaeota archaeon]